MGERPEFIAELRGQLKHGLVVAEGRRIRRRRRVVAVTALAALAVLGTGSWMLLQSASDQHVIAADRLADITSPPSSDPPSNGIDVGSHPTSQAGTPRLGQELDATLVGDGTTVTRVTTSDGSVFALRLPAAFGTRFVANMDGPAEAVSLVGDLFEARIEIGPCTYEPLTPNALGLSMAGVRLSDPPPSLSFCRPDEFLRLVIEPVPDVEFSTDPFDIVPISYGQHYVDWVTENVEPGGQQCCFEDLGPMWHQDTMVVADGYGSTHVSGLDAATLVPRWTTDLAQVLDGQADYTGDSSRLLALTESGVVVTTTGYGFLVGLDALSGKPLWTVDLDQETPGGSVAVDSNHLIVTSSITSEGDRTAPTVRLIQIETGRQLWATKGDDGTELQWTRPVVISDVVVVAVVPSYQPVREGTSTAAVSAFNVTTGARVWRTQLDSSDESYAPFETVVADASRELLLVTDASGNLYRLNPRTGTRIWTSATGLGPIVGLSPDTVTLQVGGQQVDINLETGEPAA